LIYLDNCATTKPRDEVIQSMVDSMKVGFGNPSSLHRMGFDVEKQIKEARRVIADYLFVQEGEIIFTSGGTESNNIAIQGIAKKNKKRKHIITTAIEHPAASNTIRELEKQGYEVTILSNDNMGRIDLSHLKDSLKEDTFLVSIIHVNNEIGVIQDIKEIGNIIKDYNKNIHFHVDGVQSFGKIDFSLYKSKVDTFAFSSHKVYGPKGVGGLFISKNTKLEPILFGGGQEKGIRSGTENTYGIIGFAKAVQLLSKNTSYENKKVLDLKTYLVDELNRRIEGIKINSFLDEKSSPYILNISFSDTRGEVIVHYLEEDKIFVSTSSACSSKGTTKSHVLSAIGLEDRFSQGTIRICFSYDLSYEDMTFTAEKITKAVNEIRSLTRR